MPWEKRDGGGILSGYGGKNGQGELQVSTLPTNYNYQNRDPEMGP